MWKDREHTKQQLRDSTSPRSSCSLGRVPTKAMVQITTTHCSPGETSNSGGQCWGWSARRRTKASVVVGRPARSVSPLSCCHWLLYVETFATVITWRRPEARYEGEEANNTVSKKHLVARCRGLTLTGEGIMCSVYAQRVFRCLRLVKVSGSRPNNEFAGCRAAKMPPSVR